MKPIRIFTPSLELLGEIDDYESLIFTRRWHKFGEFQITINETKQNVEHLQKGNLILIEKNKSGIIRHIEKDTGDKGNGTALVKGSTLGALLNARITIPPPGQAYDRVNSNVETIMKQYVDRNVVSPTQIKRKIPLVEIETNFNRGLSTVYQTRYKQLDSELEKLSIASGLGWEIEFEIDRLLFKVYEGRNLTTEQNELPPVIFSLDYDNIQKQKLIDSSFNHRNVAYVAGQGEGAEREIVELGEAEGLERYELMVDARDIENPLELPERGFQKLAEYHEVISFDSEVNPYSNFVYGIDWDLGDIVTVQNKKWNKVTHDRVTEVSEVYEPSGFKVSVIFGKQSPTLVDKIKQELDSPILDKSYQNDAPTRLSQLDNDMGFITADDIQQSTTYEHSQISPSSTWVIDHQLGKYPSVTIIDSGGNVVVGDIMYHSKDRITLNFNAAFAGKALLN